MTDRPPDPSPLTDRELEAVVVAWLEDRYQRPLTADEHAGVQVLLFGKKETPCGS
jgi:hypothetical protein